MRACHKRKRVSARTKGPMASTRELPKMLASDPFYIEERRNMATTHAEPTNVEEAITELYADAPELAKTAVQRVIKDMKSRGTLGKLPEAEATTAGRIGARLGKVSELTVLAPLAPGGAKRIRGFVELLHGDYESSDRIGTLHDMRFVFVNDDKQIIVATTYDGDWDAYIDDFATKMPDTLDVIFCNTEGWPGIKDPKVKDWIVKYQIPAAGWYVASPHLTVAETHRLEKVGKALDEFLDKIG